MENISPEVVLQKHGCRITEQRMKILGFLMKNTKSHALSEIERRFREKIDRVTIYRTLNIFIKKGFVLKFININGTSFFVFKERKRKMKAAHPHMRCVICGEIICLPELPAEYLKSLAKYEMGVSQFYSEGTCPNCISDN